MTLDTPQAPDAYEVTEADFEEASKNASYWARRRCMKKMQKVIWRQGNSRPPKDAEEYVKRFVLYWRDVK